MRHYTSPTGRFGIDYPLGWQIREQQAGVVFFKDDPDEGTAFALVPYQTVQGQVGPAQLLQRMVQNMRQQYPDLQWTPGQALSRPLQGVTMRLMNADVRWTGRQGQRMQGVMLVVTYTSETQPSTLFVFMGGQAPSLAFAPMRPVYLRMMQSFFAQHQP